MFVWRSGERASRGLLGGGEDILKWYQQYADSDT